MLHLHQKVGAHTYNRQFDRAKITFRSSYCSHFPTRPATVPRNIWKTSFLHICEYHRFPCSTLPVGITICYCCLDLIMTRVIAAESAATFKSTYSSRISSFTAPSKMIKTAPIETKSQFGVLVASILSSRNVVLFDGLRLFAKHVGSRLDCSNYCIVAALVGETQINTLHGWLRSRCLTLECTHVTYYSLFMAALVSTPLRYMHGLVPTPQHSSSK